MTTAASAVTNQRVKTPAVRSHQRKPMGRALALFFFAFDAANGEKDRVQGMWEQIQLIMYGNEGAERRCEIAATYMHG